MKNPLRLCLLVALLFLPAALATTGCHTAPTARVQQVTTLKVIGATVDTAMTTAAHLLKDDRITWAQWQRIAAFHDEQFQPAFNLAVAAVQADLDSVASPDVVALAGQLSALIAPYLEDAQ